MKRPSGTLLSRRGLAALIASAPAAAGAAREPQTGAAAASGPAADALAALEANRARLKSFNLPREVEPSFRFEP